MFKLHTNKLKLALAYFAAFIYLFCFSCLSASCFYKPQMYFISCLKLVCGIISTSWQKLKQLPTSGMANDVESKSRTRSLSSFGAYLMTMAAQNFCTVCFLFPPLFFAFIIIWCFSRLLLLLSFLWVFIRIHAVSMGFSYNYEYNGIYMKRT